MRFPCRRGAGALPCPLLARHQWSDGDGPDACDAQAGFMRDEPRQVIRVLKAFKTETATYELDEIYSVRASLAKQFASQGLVEIVNVDEDEDEDEDDVETPTGPAWDEPGLGTFHFDGFGWTTRVVVPAF